MSTDLIAMLSRDLTDVTRDKIMALEHAALGADPEQFPRRQCVVTHRFSEGIYSREVFLPAGTFAMGKIHLKSHIAVILGDVSFASTLEGLQRVSGMETFEVPAGVKRAAYAHADTWWTTFHPNPTNTRDLAQIERELIAPDWAALDRSAP